jgi:hypothetical protein
VAFPTTSVLDDFNRANGLLGANWTTLGGGANPPRITSNQAGNNGASGAYVGAYWNGTTYGADTECYMTVPVFNDYVGVYARVGTPTGNKTGYQASWSGSNLTLQRHNGDGSTTQLGSTVSVSQANNEKLGIECRGTTIKVYTDTGGGWVERISQTDSNYTSAGYVAWDLYDVGTLTRVDDFAGGTAAAVTQAFLPDADITTTGWTSTPLWSKLNDSSDATVVTATLA